MVKVEGVYSLRTGKRKGWNITWLVIFDGWRPAPVSQAHTERAGPAICSKVNEKETRWGCGRSEVWAWKNNACTMSNSCRRLQGSMTRKKRKNLRLASENTGKRLNLREASVRILKLCWLQQGEMLKTEQLNKPSSSIMWDNKFFPETGREHEANKLKITKSFFK